MTSTDTTESDLTSPERAASPRWTRQRQAIEDYLASCADFRTAQQIHDHLQQEGAGVSLPTVYRTLQQLAETGQVDQVRTGDAQTAYRRCLMTGHHHHLICRRCQTAVEVPGPDIQDWAAQVARDHGFSAVGHDLELYGVCADCSARGAPESPAGPAR
ncbi:MAG: transcriptional repressor [Propionibacteriaceae bacterium]|jgi:Fur family ferric uptake transcriptional regulator|nr:transcriptional repressor [Propionibacteriaceae bacterium]